MKEFFRGEKRKVGLLTLLMACVAMAGLVRSNFVLDVIEFQTSSTTTHLLLSVDNSLAWQKRNLNQPEPSSRFLDWDCLPPLHLNSPSVDIVWKWKWYGFGVGEIPLQPSYISRVVMVIIPYSSIVIPLTLLSAALLLSRPRRSPPNTIPEPSESKGR